MGRAGRHLRWLWRHPASRGRRLSVCGGWLAWQLRARLLGRREMPWVLGLRAAAAPGLHGMTVNAGIGLADLESMAFLLHLLRPGDLFLDVGANAGSYSLLAAQRGARVIAAEPNARARDFFQRSLALNGLQADIRPFAVDEASGRVRMDLDADARGHILPEATAGGTSVEATTLDALAPMDAARLVKIDVEGAEARVVAGGRRCLGEASAAIVETWGAAELHRTLASLGLQAVRYEPTSRRLAPWVPRPGGAPTQNVLFVRSMAETAARLADAPAFRLGRRYL